MNAVLKGEQLSSRGGSVEERSWLSASTLCASLWPKFTQAHSFLSLGQGPWQKTQGVFGEQVGEDLLTVLDHRRKWRHRNQPE